jgi:serine/threonine protein kinase/Tol biopolymer transport system component
MDVATDKWSRIKLLFDEALQQRSETRAAFLAQHCSEEELRDLVEKLLVCHEAASGFLENSSPGRLAALAVNLQPQFSPNDVLAERFAIIRMIARGGMGEVYEAEDLVLRAPVAIKIIRPDILEKPRSLDRFKREVLLAKQVTHPNVCRVFDLFRHNSPGSQELQGREIYFVSMELLQGETLAERLQRSGRMTTDQALTLVAQMASALSAAHQMGILHRDFKPGNVILVASKTQENIRVVVTDFGLASKHASDFSASLTLTTQNEALGTPAYMSPEQIEGRELTPATDIYSFGLVIYEIVTGVRPFEAQTPSLMFVKRFTEAPPSPRAIVPELDPRWEAAILKCLERNPENRFGKTGDVFDALLAPQSVRPLNPAPAAKRLERNSRRFSSASQPEGFSYLFPRVHLRFRLVLIVIVLVLGTGAFLASLWANPNPRVDSSASSQLTHDGLAKGGPLLADGDHVYFFESPPEGSKLGSVAVEGGETGTLPFPNSGFFDLVPRRSEVLVSSDSLSGDGGDLWVVPLLGGSPRRVGDLKARTATWSPDRTRIAFIRGIDLFVAASDGSITRQIATVPPNASGLRWSPDGRVLRFYNSIYTNGDSQSSLWQINADGTSLHPLLPSWNNPPYECCGSWTPDGKFYFFASMRGGRSDLWAIPERRSLLGVSSSAPVQLTSGPVGFYQPTISNDGKKIFTLGQQMEGELVRYDSSARGFVRFLGGISAYWVTYSRSRRSVAYINHSDHTIWRANADGTHKTQVTFAPFQADSLSWSPDEKWLAIRGRIPGKIWRVYVVPLQGGEPRQLVPGESEQGDPDWSIDGTRLCFGDVPAEYGKPTGREVLHIFDLRDNLLSDLSGSRGLWSCRWSPDGHYISAQTIIGDNLLLLDLSTNLWRQTAAQHINTPNWSADSKFIYYDSWPKEHALRRFRLSDGKVTELTDLHEQDLGSWWSGLAPDNSPLLLHDISRTEIYSLTLEYR